MKKIFTVYDSKAEAYLQPFFADTTGIATRDFEGAVNNPEHQFAKHLGDYTLFELGTFNERTAQFENLKTPLNLGLAITYCTSATDQVAEPTPINKNTGFPHEAQTKEM